MKTLGQRIKYLRGKRGLSQQQLADLVGTTQATITALETSEQQSSRYLSSIADALGADLHWLHYGDKNQQTDAITADAALEHGGSLPMIKWHDVPRLAGNAQSDVTVTRTYSCPVPHSAAAYTIMLPTDQYEGFEFGDILFVEPNITYANNDLVVGVIQGMVDLRRLVFDGHSYFFRSLCKHIPAERRILECIPSALADGELPATLASRPDMLDIKLMGKVIFKGYRTSHAA